MFTKTITYAAALALCTSSAFAGGLANEIVEAPVMEAEMAPAATSSVNPTYIVVGILAALLIAAAANDDEDNDPLPS
ncbi:hypothetical protein QTO30_08120 [Yoonia sp. GPGPB17]|uniref:hypothetical protein n=1 Tax=Yoonia sp. GPGPB17 TaxID=3026147 RepID=UPI0030BC22B0